MPYAIFSPNYPYILTGKPSVSENVHGLYGSYEIQFLKNYKDTEQKRK